MTIPNKPFPFTKRLVCFYRQAKSWFGFWLLSGIKPTMAFYTEKYTPTCGSLINCATILEVCD